MPPSSRPTAPPPAAIALHTPSALVRSGPSGNVVVMIDQRGGGDERAAEALQRAERDQLPGARREPVEQAGDREQDRAGDEDPLAPEDVRRAAAEQQEAAEQQRVAVDHPLQVGLAELQVAAGSSAARC